MVKVKVYTDKIFLEHDTGPGHPEHAGRLRAVLDVLEQKPFTFLQVERSLPEADDTILRLVHDSDYIDCLAQLSPSIGKGGKIFVDSDTILSPKSLTAARKAAGAVCLAVDDCMGGQTERAFCAVRPPGHHAEAGQAKGFCLFNNVAIGALYAKDQYRLQRLAIVDLDVHHGNGTQNAAKNNKEIFFISSHQWPLFPGTGRAEDNMPYRILNIPLAPGSGSAAFRDAYEQMVFPSLDEFSPEMIFISAGFDAHGDDPLADINLSAPDYGWVTRRLCEIADRHSGGKVISVFEGGYDLAALEQSFREHLNAMAGIEA